MTDINHRRKNKLPKNQRQAYYNNGYGCRPDEPEQRGVQSANKRVRGNTQGVGNTDQLDKSLHGWGRKVKIGDEIISEGAGIGNDFSNGHRGMAKAVKGAKKFVRTRLRFHEKAATQRMVKNMEDVNEDSE